MRVEGAKETDVFRLYLSQVVGGEVLTGPGGEKKIKIREIFKDRRILSTSISRGGMIFLTL